MILSKRQQDLFMQYRFLRHVLFLYALERISLLHVRSPKCLQLMDLKVTAYGNGLLLQRINAPVGEALAGTSTTVFYMSSI